jgi:hypothetical protein
MGYTEFAPKSYATEVRALETVKTVYVRSTGFQTYSVFHIFACNNCIKLTHEIIFYVQTSLGGGSLRLRDALIFNKK